MPIGTRFALKAISIARVPGQGCSTFGTRITEIFMKLKSLRDLYVDELRDLYNAENQLLKALPKMAKAASNPELQSAFSEHLEETEGQVQRLEQIFETLGVNPKGKTCKAMQGLIAEGKDVMDEDAPPSVMDAALIAAGQRVEHYEMAGYGCVRTFARLLGEDEAADLLQATLDEEGAADKKLTELAETVINAEAEDQEEDKTPSPRSTRNGRSHAKSAH
jgi:ferritin-like metal-binding protein YciE